MQQDQLSFKRGTACICHLLMTRDRIKKIDAEQEKHKNVKNYKSNSEEARQGIFGPSLSIAKTLT